MLLVSLARLVRGVRGGRCYRGFALALIRSVSRRGWRAGEGLAAAAAVALAARPSSRTRE